MYTHTTPSTHLARAVRMALIGTFGSLLLMPVAHAGHEATPQQQATDAATGQTVTDKDSTNSQQDSTTLTTITVTATKRETAAIDVAGGISAMSGYELQEIGAQSFSDYLGRMPGVVFNAGPAGDSTAVIRGVGTTAGLPQGQGPTGYFINEIPLTEPGYTILIPDIDTFDVKRVEVLRGPQGTLYGAASLGGAINYVTRKADASGFHAAFETSLSRTHNTDGDLGHTVKGMLNVPIIDDELAARFVLLQRVRPGYLDNIGLHRKGSNDNDVRGGRISVVWTPGPDTKLSWLSLFQNGSTDDFAYRQKALGELTRSTLLPEKFNTTFSLHSLRLDQDVGFADWTTLLSYNRKSQVLDNDFTPFYGGFGGITTPVLYESTARSSTRTAEMRLTSHADDDAFLDWLVGVNYQQTDKPYSEFISAAGAGAVLAGQYAPIHLDGDKFHWGNGITSGSERALFGEANLHLSDAWTLTLGGRWYRDEVEGQVAYYGTLYIPPFTPPKTSQAQTGFTPKVSLSWKASDDIMTYVLASKGYRFGNPNTVYPLPGFNTPSGWETDTLWNYEAGIKSFWLDHHLKVNASAFYIDWSNIQVRLYRPDGVTYGTNAGSARIRGLELATAWRPNAHFDLALNLTLLDAKLSEDVLLAATPLRSGQTLPGASDIQASASATYYWSGPHAPRLTLTGRYLSDAPATLQQPQYRINGFSQLDASFSMMFGATEITLYGNNLADKRGITFSYGDFGAGLQQFVIRPRTVGLRLHWQY